MPLAGRTDSPLLAWFPPATSYPLGEAWTSLPARSWAPALADLHGLAPCSLRVWTFVFFLTYKSAWQLAELCELNDGSNRAMPNLFKNGIREAMAHSFIGVPLLLFPVGKRDLVEKDLHLLQILLGVGKCIVSVSISHPRWWICCLLQGVGLAGLGCSKTYFYLHCFYKRRALLKNRGSQLLDSIITFCVLFCLW